jgi:lipopolysaccharide/colanic/teichoic acid biosynthesis glycosyltransferase
MFLTRLMFAARRRNGRSAAAALEALRGPEEFERALQRERARSDRTGEVFSLAVFTVGSRPEDLEALGHLARILQKRLRLTDDAGRLGPRRLGILLPATTAAGAWTVVDDVFVCVPAGLPLPDCTVYCYPSDWLADEDLAEDVEYEDPEVRRPVRPMETLFVRRLPLWKRCLDVLGAALGLLAFSPLLAAVAVAVKLTSPGPVFFRQKRSGLGGKEFIMLKFRSMAADAEARKSSLAALNEQDGPVFKIRNDPRVTRLGRFLRSTSIDELPQLWNVLRGEMSLVGPRPLPCDETAAGRGWLRRRLDVTPGLTCFWQVRGRSTVSFADWVRMDVEYVRRRSLPADLLLLLQTVPAVVSRRGAS